MTWSKIDTGFHRNPKVRMAGRDARDVYLFVLLANAERGADGELNALILDPDYLADQLQCSPDEARNGVKRCETFHLLHVTGQIVTICGWDEEWQVTTSTDRVRKHRAKKKQALAPDETGGNVSPVTCNDETPRERDRERYRKRDRGGAKRAQAITDDWQPNEKHTALAADLNLDIADQAERFRDHFTANGKPMKDWNAAFRNWLKRSKDYGTGKSSNSQQPLYPLLHEVK